MELTCDIADSNHANAELLTKLARSSVVTSTGYTTPCHLWQGAKTREGGYGQMRVAGRLELAHRVAYQLRYGLIPGDKCLDHLCRRTGCVNPEHLEPVTNAENCRRGRNTKLTIRQVAAIRASDDTQHVLARRFGISQSQISRIKAHHSWRP